MQEKTNAFRIFAGQTPTDDYRHSSKPRQLNDKYWEKGFRSPPDRAYQPIGLMSDLEQFYLDIKHTFNLPLNEDEEHQPNLKNDYIRTFYFSEESREKSLTHKTLANRINDHKAMKEKRFNEMLALKFGEKSNRVPEKLDEYIDKEHLKSKFQHIENELLTIQKVDEHKEAPVLLRKHIKRSNQNTFRARAGASLQSISNFSAYDFKTSPRDRSITTQGEMRSRSPKSFRGTITEYSISPRQNKAKLSTKFPGNTSADFQVTRSNVFPLQLDRLTSPCKKSAREEFNIVLKTPVSNERNQHNHTLSTIETHRKELTDSKSFFTTQVFTTSKQQSRYVKALDSDREGYETVGSKDEDYSKECSKSPERETEPQRVATEPDTVPDPFIKIPWLYNSLKSGEHARMRKLMTHPAQQQIEKPPLKYRIVHKIEEREREESMKKSHKSAKGNLPFSKMNSRRDIFAQSKRNSISGASSKSVNNPNQNPNNTALSPNGTDDVSPNRFKFFKRKVNFQNAVKRVMRKNLVVRNWKNETYKIKDDKIEKLEMSFFQYFENKDEKDKDLRMQLTQLQLNRKKLFETKSLNLNRTLRTPKTPLRSYLKSSQEIYRDLMKEPNSEDAKWYTELVNELSTHNYPLNSAIIQLFDKIKPKIERGIPLTKDMMFGFVYEIEPILYRNKTFLYLLKVIGEKVGMTTDDWVNFFKKRELKKIVAMF